MADQLSILVMLKQDQGMQMVQFVIELRRAPTRITRKIGRVDTRGFFHGHGP